MSQTIEITMPRLSDSMEQGTVLKWLVAEGATVKPGDELVEIETDKAAMTYEAEAEGSVSSLAPEGETYAVGEVIGRLGPAESGAVTSTASDDERPLPATGNGDIAEASFPPVATTVAKAAEGSSATPLARRIAVQHDVELAGVTGTGPRGRITRDDVLKAAGLELPRARSPRPAQAAPTAKPAADVASHRPSGRGRPVDLTPIQRIVAARMSEAKATVPEFSIEAEVDMGAVVELRGRLKAGAGERPVASFNDMIVKATALALREHPRVNGSFLGDRVELFEEINIGIAVATDDALIVPVIADADQKPLATIAAEGRELAERVRHGRITPPELEGGTFTVSNLGMYGMSAITPIINIPQAAILGVGALREIPMRSGGQIIDRRILTLRLVCDHRILNGAEAARFLARVKQLLEWPLEFAL